jgi:hypothetical protein
MEGGEEYLTGAAGVRFGCRSKFGQDSLNS